MNYLQPVPGPASLVNEVPPPTRPPPRPIGAAETGN